MSPRHPTPPQCDWPRSTCHEAPTVHDPKGAAFCDEHYRAWAAVMQAMLQAFERGERHGNA
jgi:hypothetical protein